MKKSFVILLSVGFIIGGSVKAQTLFVPSGTGGIGTSTSGFVGVGTSYTNPPRMLSVTTSQMNGGLRVTQTNSGFSAVELYNTTTTPTHGTYGSGHNYALVSTGANNTESGGAFGLFDYTFGGYKLFIKSDSKMGINTVTPSAFLHTVGYYGVHAGTNLPLLALERKSGYGTVSMGLWTVHLSENATNTNHANLTFNSNLGDVFKLYPNGDGKLGGKLTCKEIKVTNTPWADYVFDDNYQLMTITELEQYVTTNNHLPNVPTTEEMTANGSDLAETDKILLEKIEELTLYVIELQKQINDLQNNK